MQALNIPQKMFLEKMWLTCQCKQVLAAILNRYYNFAHPNSLAYLRWYVGEVATAVYVVNVPACWPLLRKVFKLDNWSRNRTVTSLPTINSYTHQSSKSGNKLHSVFHSIDRSPGFSESEVHLTEVSGSQWEGKGEPLPTWPLSVHETHVNATKVVGEDIDVQDGSIVKRIEVTQQRSQQLNDR